MAAGFTPAATLRRYSPASRRFEKTFRKSEQREREQPRAKRQAMRGNRQVPSYTFVCPSMMITPLHVKTRSTTKPTPMFDGS